MQQTRIPYANTRKFSSLVLDFLNSAETISDYFGNMPTLDGFKKQIALKSGFEQVKRDVLADQLKVQYAHLNLKSEDAERIENRIELLRYKNTFTVTTGHQLCLFTGPLYTVYKIIHVIRLAEELSAKFPENTFLPVFWMATEDHDFAEVNHIHIKGHKITWRAEPGDAVGRMKTAGIAKAIEELAFRLPESSRSAKLLDDLKSAYLGEQNLADATRALVHNWFGEKGLLIVDGDDKELKRTMVPAFQRELLENTSYTAVSKTNAELEKSYKVQVTPREINLFYLNNGFRSRIVKNGKTFTALDTEITWAEDELKSELQSHPERFSPNVLLRPLYQESILPNLAYIGGGGEIAYWAQLKAMFNAFQVPFPIVVLRQSVQLETKRLARKRHKLNLKLEELFGDYHTLSNMLIKRECDYEIELAPFRAQLENVFADIKKVTNQLDSSLETNVEAQKTKALKRLMQLEKKMIRAAKRQDNDHLRMLKEWQDELLPSGGLQERRNNIIEHWVQFGDVLWEELYRAVQPLDFEFLVLTEE